jgi:hypothetical protein
MAVDRKRLADGRHVIQLLYPKVGPGPVCTLMNDLYLHDAFPLLFGRLERLYSLESPSLPPAHNRSGDRFLLEETVSDVLTMGCRGGMQKGHA